MRATWKHNMEEEPRFSLPPACTPPSTHILPRRGQTEPPDRGLWPSKSMSHNEPSPRWVPKCCTYDMSHLGLQRVSPLFLGICETDFNWEQGKAPEQHWSGTGEFYNANYDCCTDFCWLFPQWGLEWNIKGKMTETVRHLHALQVRCLNLGI